LVKAGEWIQNGVFERRLPTLLFDTRRGVFFVDQLQSPPYDP